MTQFATVQVRYVNRPKPGKKMGSIKTADDVYFSVHPSKLGYFQPGGTYDIEYSSREYNGTVFYTVENIANSDGAVPAPAPRAQQRSASPATQAAPAQFMKNPKEQEQIFCVAIMKSMIEAGQIQPTMQDHIDTINSLREVFRQTFGKQETPATPAAQPPTPRVQPMATAGKNADMDDEIPF